MSSRTRFNLERHPIELILHLLITIIHQKDLEQHHNTQWRSGTCKCVEALFFDDIIMVLDRKITILKHTDSPK